MIVDSQSLSRAHPVPVLMSDLTNTRQNKRKRRTSSSTPKRRRAGDSAPRGNRAAEWQQSTDESPPAAVPEGADSDDPSEDPTEQQARHAGSGCEISAGYARGLGVHGPSAAHCSSD